MRWGIDMTKSFIQLTTLVPEILAVEGTRAKTVNYTKPEIVILGDATRLIRGRKQAGVDPSPQQAQPEYVLDSELDE